MLRFENDIDPLLTRETHRRKLVDGRTHVKEHVRAAIEQTSVFGDDAVRDRAILRLKRTVANVVERQTPETIPS